ncbi:hypothetical protein SNE40_000170 [Patella caerulea]|uniref:Prolow-density lipoprotein receptor-related protein 1-like beta-propeller domain-containing protein n=1 Tax=Patella caerulea TaxID=87958 RepID=A0AAN8KKJ3_PATCE
MSTLFIFLWMILPFCTESLVFPRQDESPLIAVLGFDRFMNIFDPSDGPNATVLERINLMGGDWGGASCSIDFNYRDNVIYWSDYYESKVYSLKVNGGDYEQRVILEDGLDFPEGLAYDWIHNNLYISDFRRHEILVVNPDTGDKRTLITGVPDIRDVEVDPRTGWLYWISGWEDTAVLMKSTLDGQNQVVISSDLAMPKTLSLDYDEQRLYWTEMSPLNIIKSIGVDGEGLTTVYQTVSGRLSTPPKYLTISREYLYWNQGHETIRRADKHQVTEITRYRNVEERDARGKPTNMFMGILAIDPRKQMESENFCGNNNGGCSHFCLPTLIQSTPPYNCACPDGMNLMDDNYSCFDERQM